MHQGCLVSCAYVNLLSLSFSLALLVFFYHQLLIYSWVLISNNKHQHYAWIPLVDCSTQLSWSRLDHMDTTCGLTMHLQQQQTTTTKEPFSPNSQAIWGRLGLTMHFM
jgi:hypothetical protein